ncbi:TetR/AcrR family transcriptional regulator [Antrihabitans stalactiti]|nr:TetR/AcrR family transcriptional regulator [Antrihabitans stalactiti]
MTASPVTRARILTAARPVVDRFTVTKFSMEDVARAAGVARQTIYKHFTGRDDLLVAIFVEQLVEMRRGLTRVAANEPTAGNLVRLFEAELDEAMKFQFFDSMLDPNVAPRMAELVFGSQAMFDERNRTWFPILQRYVDAGIVRSNLDFAAAVRWITYQEFWLLTHPTVLTGGHENRSTYIREFVVHALLA